MDTHKKLSVVFRAGAEACMFHVSGRTEHHGPSYLRVRGSRACVGPKLHGDVCALWGSSHRILKELREQNKGQDHRPAEALCRADPDNRRLAVR